MNKCNDFWCEHYDKNNGNCDKCLKRDKRQGDIELNVILKRRVYDQMKSDTLVNEKSHEKSR